MINKIKDFLRPIKLFVLTVYAYLISTFNKNFNKNFKCDRATKRCSENIKSPYYKYELIGKNIPVCCATHLYELIRDVTSLLSKNDIEYFICCGTLLGAIRHKGLIPWDTDIDIVIPYQKKNEVFDILTKELDNKYMISFDKKRGLKSLIRVFYSKKNTIHIDLFVYKIELDKVQAFKENRLFDYKDIFPLRTVKFYDLELNAPKNPKLHLEKLYGNSYMKYAYKQWALNKRKFPLTDYNPAEIEIK